MWITPLSLNDCARAAQLHQTAFYKGWKAEDFLNFLQDPYTFGLKLQQNDVLQGFALWREIRGEAELLTFVINFSSCLSG